MKNAGDEDWSVLTSLFPSGWQAQARRTGAVARLRGFASAEELLRVVLLHIAQGYSLRETMVRAEKAGLAGVSDVALLNRLRGCEKWLQWLCGQLLVENGVRMPAKPGQRVVRLVDGTIVKEPGKTGSQWRILYSLQLPDLVCDYFDLTSAKGVGHGESFTRVPVEAGDLLLADAGYCSVAGIESVVKRHGDVLVRINPQNFPAQDAAGRRIPILRRVSTLERAGQIGEWKVFLPGEQRLVEGRVCALRKSEHAIGEAHRRLERKASKKQTQVKPESWEYAKYVLVFASWPELPASQVLEWYRVRWQVELAFKRLKSLAQLGHLPKSDEQSSRAWLYGKLFVGLLTEKLIRIGRDISPWGYILATEQAPE